MIKLHNWGTLVFLLMMLVGCSQSTLEARETPSDPIIRYLETSTPTVTNIAVEISGDNLTTSIPDDFCKKVPEPVIETTLSNIHMSGKFYLCSYDGTQNAFDFDSGRLVSAESMSSDLKLVISGASIDNRTIYYLRENNGAFVDVSELSIPNIEYCEKLLTENRLTLVLGSVGATGCILTNEGRLGFFQVVQENPVGLESIQATFTVWEKR